MIFLVGASVVLLGLVSWTLMGLLDASRLIAARMSQGTDGRLVEVVGAFEARLKGVEDDVDRLPSKWEDVKRESQSLYQRARHHVRRANEELEARGLADPELVELDQQLQLIDGAGSGEEAVQPMPEGMESASPPDPAPGSFNPNDWRHATLRRKYG